MASNEKAARKKAKVLIVEDSATQAEQLRYILEEEGYLASVADNGEQALLSLSKDKPDIVISDIVMPEMDGYQLCEQLKGDDNFKNVPVVLLTALSAPEDVAKGLQCGADHFITKPYDRRYLISRLQSILANRELRRTRRLEMGIEVVIGGKSYFIKSDRLQILDFLISTYETALQQNRQLARTRDELKELNEGLEEKVRERTAALTSEIAQRRQAEQRIMRLNWVLKALRDVNQLIVHEKERDRLIQSACDLLVKAPSYSLAWILLVDENRNFVSFAAAGLREDMFSSIVEQLSRGKYLQCAREIFSNELAFAFCDDVEKYHRGCPLASHHIGGAGFTAKLEYEGRVYGVMSVDVPRDVVMDAEEQGLFQELAGDISFALANINSEEERQHIARQLEQSEEKYSKLVERSNDAIIIIQNGMLKFVNSRMVEMTGVSLEEALGKPFVDFVAPDYRETAINAYKKRMSGEGAPGSYEIEIIAKDGRKIPVEVTANMIDYEHAPADMAIVRDITQRKQAAEALRESEERHRTLFESAAEGILIADIETKKLKYANPAVCRMLGYSLQELSEMTVSDLHPTASLGYVLAEFDCQARGEKTLSPALPCLKKDGTVTYADVSAAKAVIDGRECNVGFFVDVTARKQMEEALRQSEEKLRLMFESAADAIVVTDLNGLITDVNRVILEMHGVKSKESVLGKNALEFVVERERERAKADLQELTERGVLKGAEYDLVREDGTEYPGELNGNLLADRSGCPFGLILLIRDITERKKMEEQLMVTDRLASIGELSSGIAHELNNPLTTVIGMSELLLDKDIPSDIKEDLQLVTSEAQRAAGVVKNLLTFARKHAPVKQPVNVNGIIQKVLELRAYEQRVNNIQVNRDFSSDLPEIMADYFQLQQVFLNIIINAEYFMTEAHQRGTLSILTGSVNDAVRVIFIDDGPGIAKENRGHIFDPFFTTKPVGKGTGLGLSICHGIVTEHGGRIYAKSELGKGTTFIVELPIGNIEREAEK